MSEVFTINNFGPIKKKMSFEFKKINILIGDQGTGKSTVAKVIAAITSMADGDSQNLGAIKILSSKDYGTPKHFLAHLKVYDINNYLQGDTFIEYKSEKFKFLYKNSKSSLKIGENQIASYQGNISDVTYIPADRAAVNLFTNEVLLSFNELQADLPAYFIRFARLYNRIKKFKEGFDFSDIVGVKYQYKGERDIIILPGGHEIDLKESSSALQTNVSLLIILSYIAKYEDRLANVNTELNLLIIEEPEFNCSPALQTNLINYIIYCLRNDDKKLLQTTLITTHSPYILSCLNNLMFAYQSGQNNEVEIGKIINKKYWVNPGDVSAYIMLSEGGCERIIDSEDLIRTEKIDSASEILNKEFDEMFDIDLAIKK